MAAKSAEEVIEHSDLIIIAVKPYLVQEVIGPLVESLKGKTILSVVSGHPLSKWKTILGEDVKCYCTIPNTPIRVGKGIMIVDETHSVDDTSKQFIEDTFSKIALIEPMPSHLTSISGTVCGCGPAFVDLFIEGLSDAGLMHGIPRAQSYRLVSTMIEGSAALQKITQTHPGILKDQVCSPKGSTIQGVATLEKHRFRYALIDAINQVQQIK